MRKYQIAVFFMLKFMLFSRIDEPPEDGVYTHGLFIEGARWDGTEMIVVEQLPKVVIEAFPIIHFIVRLFLS